MGLKNGLGKLEMVGAGTDNGKPAEMHVVMTVGRNILRVVEETRPAGSAEAYAFRHEYRFVRAEPPVASGRGWELDRFQNLMQADGLLGMLTVGFAAVLHCQDFDRFAVIVKAHRR